MSEQSVSNLATAWEAVADAIGDRPALIHGPDIRTWTEFDDRSARIAGHLVSAGLRPDAKVALYLYNGPEYLEATFGSFKARAVPVNVNYRYLETELHYLLDNSDAEAVVVSAELARPTRRGAARTPEDPDGPGGGRRGRNGARLGRRLRGRGGGEPAHGTHRAVG